LFKTNKYQINNGIYDFSINHPVTSVIKKFYEVKKFESHRVKKIKLNAKMFTKNYTLFYHHNSLIKILEKE